MMRDRSVLAPVAVLAAIVAVASAQTSSAAEDSSHALTLGDSSFSPNTLAVPSGVKIRLTVRNARKVPAEFESNDLNREKVIAPGTSAVVYIGPLQPGSYSIFDDFNASTRGTIVAK